MNADKKPHEGPNRKQQTVNEKKNIFVTNKMSQKEEIEEDTKILSHRKRFS